MQFRYFNITLSRLPLLSSLQQLRGNCQYLSGTNVRKHLIRILLYFRATSTQTMYQLNSGIYLYILIDLFYVFMHPQPWRFS